MPRVQLALNASDIDGCGRLPHQAVWQQASQAPFRLRQLRDRRATADARAAGEPWRWRTVSHLGIEVPRTGMVGAEQARLAGTSDIARLRAWSTWPGSGSCRPWARRPRSTSWRRIPLGVARPR